MANFNYAALDNQNTYVKGKIQERNLKRANQTLEKQGLLVVSLKKEKNSKIESLSKISTVTRLDKIFFTRHIYTLLESGIALDQATKIAAEQHSNPKFKNILYKIHEEIRQGKNFHNALENQKKYFSEFFINLVKVGEKSGKLNQSLLHLLEQQERDYDLIKKARGAMIYPSIIIMAAVAIVILMMTFVIPSITGILLEYDVELPLTTKILIFTSNFIINYGIILAAVIVVLIFLLRKAIKTPKGKWYWENFLFSIPVLKNIIIEFNLARLTRAMSALLESGTQIDQALDLAATVVKNSHYQKSLKASVGFVRKGIPLTEVLHGYPKIYPAITTRMLEIGQKTGKLDHMFSRVAIFYEKSVANTLTSLASIIEPFLLLGIGLVVGFVAVSILTPIWKFAQSI